MARGPAPKSKAHLQRDGSWRADDRPDDLQLDPKIPKAPARLSREEKTAWKEIAEILGPKNVLTSGDAASLELLVCELVRYRRRKKQLEKVDRAGGDSMALRRIESSMKEAFANYINVAARFGLTPADRTRVKTGGEKRERKMDQFKRPDALGPIAKIGA